MLRSLAQGMSWSKGGSDADQDRTDMIGPDPAQIRPAAMAQVTSTYIYGMVRYDQVFRTRK